MNRYAAPLLALLCLAAAAASLPAPARAQANTSLSEQTFDYNPDAGKEMPEIQQSIAETTFEDAEMINHPVYGTTMLSKHRWKNWVTRALYLALINIALIAITLSMARTSEYNLIISYILSGASFTLSFWTFLCAVLVFQLKSSAWIYILPVSAVTAGVGYLVLMKIKRSDVSFTELKESFQKMRSAAVEDSRLTSVDGAPGDWPDDDFVRHQ
ncbi:MAG: hypothetical protein PHV36_15200 [Elusimicrobiales bacterium]|nr:hypothetical protein [Elusimicrobiales bacterium]